MIRLTIARRMTAPKKATSSPTSEPVTPARRSTCRVRRPSSARTHWSASRVALSLDALPERCPASGMEWRDWRVEPCAAFSACSTGSGAISDEEHTAIDDETISVANQDDVVVSHDRHMFASPDLTTAL